MAINYPISLDVFQNPTSTDQVANANPLLIHSTQHSNTNDAIEAIEAKIGVDGSAVTTSHDYKLGEVISTDKAVGKTATQTLTNKTLTSPTITNKTSTGTDSGTETLTNKTLTTPTIVDFTNAQHDHLDADDGGQLTEGALNLTDVTTNNATISKHGFLQKLPGNTSTYLRGDGTFSTIANIQKFGGTGTDGALTTSSGTTNYDLASAAYFEKNFTSISITGTANITFTNPHASGTIIVLKSQGNVTITTSAGNAINVTNLGAATDKKSNSTFTGNRQGSAGVSATNTGGGGGGGSSISNDGSSGSAGTGSSNGAGGAGGLGSGLVRFISKNLSCGAGGGTGGTGTGAGAGAGGRGGGALFIECAGSLNTTSAMSAAGTNGANATAGQSGGGGGGGGGAIVILGNTIVASSSTLTVTGGTGGTGHSLSFSGGAGGAGGAGYSFAGLNTDFQ